MSLGSLGCTVVDEVLTSLRAGRGHLILPPRVGHVPMWDDARLVVHTITDSVEAHRTAPEGAALSLAGQSAGWVRELRKAGFVQTSGVRSIATV